MGEQVARKDEDRFIIRYSWLLEETIDQSLI